MGAGFYDRTFAFKNERNLEKPLLVGLAYEEQVVESVPTEPWDVPINKIFTEKGLRT